MSLPATDNFNRADSTTTLGGNWTDIWAGFGISGNQAYNPQLVNNFTLAYWNADTPGNDQYVQAVVSGFGGGGPHDLIGVAARVTGTVGAENDYLVVFDSSGAETQLLKYVGGAGTVLSTLGGAAAANGDTIKLSIVGTTIQVFKNGVQVGSDVVDAAVASGQFGVASIVSGSSNPKLDTWEGGNTAVQRTFYLH